MGPLEDLPESTNFVLDSFPLTSGRTLSLYFVSHLAFLQEWLLTIMNPQLFFSPGGLGSSMLPTRRNALQGLGKTRA